MTIALNGTHDPARRSWVDSANHPDTDFPLQNLPLGMFRAADGAARPCTAIGDLVLDIWAAQDMGLLVGPAAQAAEIACRGCTLNALIEEGPSAASALRAGLFYLLGTEGVAPQWGRAAAEHLLRPIAETTMLLPVAVAGFTDCLCSLPHATRMGALLDRPLPPQFRHLPIAYNGRASSVAVSGTGLPRPRVQQPGGGYGPSLALDFELELGCWLRGGNALGQPLSMAQAAAGLFGYSLLNDWSARDIQNWESTPLGPFLGKSLLTTVSPWIITAEALAPFACPATARGADEPTPLPYLTDAADQQGGGLDVTLEAWIEADGARTLACRTGFASAYWTFAQMVAHHASNGCPMRTGDLIGSGTASDDTQTGRACLAERGGDALAMSDGGTRRFLLDGDTVVLRGRAQREGYVSIGFGDCMGTVLPPI